MAEKGKKPSPTPPPSPSDDLPPRGNLPEESVIPEWQRFGYGAPKPTPKPRTPPKKREMRSGGMARSSASRRADGIAQRGKTRGKFV